MPLAETSPALMARESLSTEEAPRSLGAKSDGSRGCTRFLAARARVRRSFLGVATPLPCSSAAVRITAGIPTCPSGLKEITFTPASSRKRKAISSLRAESSSTSERQAPDHSARVRWLLRFAAGKIPGGFYQILQVCSRTIACPCLQPKAFANSAMFESGPFARNLPSGCGLVLAINRAYSSRSLAPHT